MSTPRPLAPDPLDLRRWAFVLYQLASAPGGRRTQADANRKVPSQIQDELSLTPAAANQLRTALKDQGLIREVSGGGVAYAITEAGSAWLGEHAAHIPLAPARGKVNPPPDGSARDGREAWLLLQLLDHPDGATAGVLNKKPGPAKLGMNAATARHVRGDLVVRQLITVARTARSERFATTPAGVAHLAGLSFDGLGTVKIAGTALTRLLRAAGGVPNGLPLRTPDAPPAPPPPPLPSADQLQAAVMDVFHGLLRERFASIRMVPIHEIRAAVAARHGADAASHAVFDDVLLALRRAKRIGLVSIDDRSRATADQLRDSVFAVGETFFYAETPNVPHG